MARAARKLIDKAASAWGRGIAKYSRAALSSLTPEVLLETNLPRAPVVFIGWHEANMLTLVAHACISSRPAIAFVPPGIGGRAMRGWLEELGIAPVALAPDARRGLGLRQMRSALADGKDVLIAVDGPKGPRHAIAPGALWLARASGAEVRPVGCATSLAFRLPRWDGLLVPLPGTCTVLAVGAPWACMGAARGSDAARDKLAQHLHWLTDRAHAALKRGRAFAEKEVAPWP
jgi:lysophospholipid acyltransferase (LPLAT)-like uncharacterized protein